MAVPGSGRLPKALITDHCTQPSDYKGSDEGSLHGWACRAAPEQGQRPFPPLPDEQGARQLEEAADREQKLSWPQSFLPAATKGRAPWGLELAFPGKKMA